MRLRASVVAAFTLLAGCSYAQVQRNAASPPDTSYVWTRVLDAGPWAKSYNFQMFGDGGRLRIFHPDGVWESSDGRGWSKVPLRNAINNLAFLDYVYFRNAIYGLGYFHGNIERFTFRPDIVRTRDYRQWETLAKRSNLPRRFFYHPFVFRDKIWIIGGEDKGTKHSDIWNSSDGITWTQQRDRSQLGERSNSQIVELNGTLYLLNNDVWSSTDGLEWRLVTAEIVKGEQIFGYAAIVFDGKIWLLGCNRNGRFASEVLVSGNGKDWTAMSAPWSPRGGIAAAVFNDKVYMTGGKYGGTPDHVEFIYSNDLWTLERSN